MVIVGIWIVLMEGRVQIRLKNIRILSTKTSQENAHCTRKNVNLLQINIWIYFGQFMRKNLWSSSVFSRLSISLYEDWDSLFGLAPQPHQPIWGSVGGGGSGLGGVGQKPVSVLYISFQPISPIVDRLVPSLSFLFAQVEGGMVGWGRIGAAQF